MAVFLRKMLGIGKLPEDVRAEVEAEGILHIAEFVPVTRRLTGRVPGMRSKGSISSYVGSLVLTNQRALGTLSSLPKLAGRTIDLRWEAPQQGAVKAELSAVDGVLDVDVAEEGEMIWSVRGAERPRSGPEIGPHGTGKTSLASEVARAPKALAARAVGAALARQGSDEKSVVASGVLSLLLGPFGWLYAAPLREAVPGVAIYVGLCSLLPHFLLVPLLGIAAPISGVAGVYYAWRHNQTGERTGLFSDKKKK